MPGVIKSQLPAFLSETKTPTGKGILANAQLPAGTVLCEVSGAMIDYEDTLDMGSKESYALQVDFDKYLRPDYPFYLFNHSCDPNAGIRDMKLITLRTIAEGDELKWDYSTSMFERGWEMDCSCCADNCRKRIKDFDKLPTDTRDRYKALGIVMPYIIKPTKHLN